MAGVSERGPAHHRQRHDARGSSHPGVNPSSDGYEAKGATGVQQKPNRDESVADVKDEQQPFTTGAVAGPASKPDQMQHAGQSERIAAPYGNRRHNPANQCSGSRGDAQYVEAGKRYRKPAGILLDQPVAGEARNDPTTDQRNQQHDDGNTDTDT